MAERKLTGGSRGAHGAVRQRQKIGRIASSMLAGLEINIPWTGE